MACAFFLFPAPVQDMALANNNASYCNLWNNEHIFAKRLTYMDIADY